MITVKRQGQKEITGIDAVKYMKINGNKSKKEQRKKSKKPKKTEEQEQEALFQYAGLQKEPEWSLLFAIPNGGFRSKRTGARMKRTGLKAGIPDLMLPVVRGQYPGLWIEMKSEKGRVQHNQAEWHDKLRGEGYRVEVCRGCDQAVSTIKEYLNLKDTRDYLHGFSDIPSRHNAGIHGVTI